MKNNPTQFSTLQKWFLMPTPFWLYDKLFLLILAFVFVDIWRKPGQTTVVRAL